MRKNVYTLCMNNVTLIGMPSAGKSTVGVVLAKITGRRFIDTDLLIQEKYGALLPDIIARMGTDGFIRAESGVLESLAAENAVIATGGSAVYGAAGMARLKDISVVAYLRVPLSALTARLSDFGRRGVVTLGADSVESLLKERAPLYEKYADVVVDETGIEDTARRIADLTGGRR